MPKVGLAASKAKPKKQPAKEQSHADGADTKTSNKFSPLQYYEEIRHLGSGAFGSAVLVRRIKDGRRLVAKKCSVKDMEEKQRNMCFEEIALLQKVRHECVAQLVDFVWASKDMLSYWIVLKFYPGGDVQTEIDTCRENDLELPMGKVKNWVTQLCMALKHVHKLRIVHRDVKGSNMFITGARNIVLGDFGVSKQLSESQQKAMTSVGSPMYMAPEWWDGRGGTAYSDMWSVGVVLYELLALRRPFEAQNVLSLVHKITTEDPPALPTADRQLSSLALELLNKRPERRPTAAQALESKGLEDAEKILQIYREALEKKSDRHQRRLAREEDVAAGRKPRPSRSSSISSECESSGNAAGLRAVNLVDIARRQAAASSAVDEEEGFSEDDEDSSSSWGSDSEEEEEEAPLATDSDASKDSWSGVPVEFEDAQSLAEVLAGAKKKAQVGTAAQSSTSKDSERPGLPPACEEDEAVPSCIGATDSLTFSAVTGAFSEPSDLDKETDFALTEQSHLETLGPTSKAEKTAYPMKQLEAVREITSFPVSKAVSSGVAGEVTSLPSENKVAALSPVCEVTAFPDVPPVAPKKKAAEQRPTLTTSSSDSWGDAQAILETQDGEGVGMVNSKTLQGHHKEKEIEAPEATPKASEESSSEQSGASEEDAEDESEEEEAEEEDHEIEEDVEAEASEEVESQEDQDEHIEETILMDRTRNPAENATAWQPVQEPRRSQPTFSVAPPLEDFDEIEGRQRMTSSGAGKVTFSSWSAAGDAVQQRCISEDPDLGFRSSTRTTFRSSRSEGRSTSDSTGWVKNVRRTTLAAMSGALSRPDDTSPLDFHAPPREVKSRPKPTVLASTAYPTALADDDFHAAEPANLGQAQTHAGRFSFRPGRNRSFGRRCVTLNTTSTCVAQHPRSQSLGSAPRDVSSVLPGLSSDSSSRPKTTGMILTEMQQESLI